MILRIIRQFSPSFYNYEFTFYSTSWAAVAPTRHSQMNPSRVPGLSDSLPARLAAISLVIRLEFSLKTVLASSRLNWGRSPLVHKLWPVPEITQAGVHYGKGGWCPPTTNVLEPKITFVIDHNHRLSGGSTVELKNRGTASLELSTNMYDR